MSYDMNGLSAERRAYLAAEKRHARYIVLMRYVILIAILFLWELAARLSWIDPFITSSPSRVAATIGRLLPGQRFQLSFLPAQLLQLLLLLLQPLCLPLDRFRPLRILRRLALMSLLDLMYLHSLHHDGRREGGNGQPHDHRDHPFAGRNTFFSFCYRRHTTST